MEKIENTIAVFERLRKYSYKIFIENGVEIDLRFSREHFHHLVGFQHLTDLESVYNPHSRQKFYGDFRKGKISAALIKKSAQYGVIRERVETFEVLEDILTPGDGKIIVEFDNSKTDSIIKAKFHLYRRMGDPFKGEAVFFTLFIDSENGSTYFPVTYIVEKSNLYVREQTMYTCRIERQPLNSKKALAAVR